MYGMEKIREYYESDTPVFVTEGIVCALWLRQNGFNSLALTGSYLSPYGAEILRRFGRRCVVIPDSDEAGNKLARTARYLLPNARIAQSKLAKDVDDTQRLHPDANLRGALAKLAGAPCFNEVFILK
jgi:DNA primase